MANIIFWSVIGAGVLALLGYAGLVVAVMVNPGDIRHDGRI